MTDVAKLLAGTKTVLLIDWPSRDVPDTLARRGLVVLSEEGREAAEYYVYEVEADDVRRRRIGRPPERVDLVYAHRPLDELTGIVHRARSLGATAVWIQSGRDKTGAKDPQGSWMPAEDSAAARKIVETAGLMYVDSPYIVYAVRALDR